MASRDGRTSIFIDSHAHLADAAFTGDRDAVISRARDAGARAIVCIGESLAAAAIAAQYAADNPRFVFATAGIHPHDAATFEASRDVPRLRELIGGLSHASRSVSTPSTEVPLPTTDASVAFSRGSSTPASLLDRASSAVLRAIPDRRGADRRPSPVRSP